MSHRALIPFLFAVSSASIALFTTSCSVVDGPLPTVRKSQRVLYKWYDDGGEGPVTIRISLTDQIADIQRGGRDIGWCFVATGKEGHGTTVGTFRITEKIVDKHSNAYGWFEDEFGNVTDGDARSRDKVPPGMVYVPAPMPYWMRLTNYGIGMHGGLIPEPGKPASHGCIRMPKEFVPLVFDAVKVGTVVTITNEPSKHGINHSELHQLEHDWTTDPAISPANSVTYHNGLPVSWR